MVDSLIKGTIWSAVQRLGSLSIGFISNIVLARLLCPEDFGAMAMVMVFVGIADVIIDGGLGNALIQKPNVDEKDIKTVFTTNLLFSVFLFFLFFILAPFIEDFTNIKNLTIYLRVESFQILFRALYVIPVSLMQKDFNFSRLAKINIVASVLSVIIAITLSLFGFGIWSLIIKNLSLDFFLLILYICNGHFSIKIGFSKESFKQLFGFGFFVVLSNLFETLYTNIVSFFIGRKYNAKELGYYNQAYTLQQIPTYSITAVLNQVLFPYFSKIQDSQDQLSSKLRLSIQIITFVVFPLLIFLICFAEQVIILLYSDKWILSVVYFKILCFSGLLNAVIHINRSFLKSKGCTKTIFFIQVSSTIIGICLLLIGLNYSMIMGVTALAINSIILYVMTATMSGKQSNYTIKQQIVDVLPNLLFSVVCAIVCFFISKVLYVNIIVTLLIKGILYFSLYMLLHHIFKTRVCNTIKQMIKIRKR